MITYALVAHQRLGQKLLSLITFMANLKLKGLLGKTTQKKLNKQPYRLKY